MAPYIPPNDLTNFRQILNDAGHISTGPLRSATLSGSEYDSGLSLHLLVEYFERFLMLNSTLVALSS